MNETQCLIGCNAAARPNQVAVVDADREYTYAEADTLVAQGAGFLRARHAHGAIIGMLAASDAASVFGFHAILRAGMIAFPMSTRLPPAVVRKQWDEFRCAALYAEKPPLSFRECPCYGPDILRAADAFVTERRNDDAAATLVMSSGSSGQPKSVVHSYRNHRRSAELANHNVPLAPGDRWLLSLPLFHVSGIAILFRCALAGATVAVAPGVPLEEAIPALGVTHVSLVATQLGRLLESDAGHGALRSLKAILLGGGPTPEPLLRRAWEMGLPLFASYGMTETASQIVATPAGADFAALSGAGRPLQPGSVKLAPDGEILVGGDTLFLGYRTPAGIVRPLDDSGYFATGDLGSFDAHGNLQVLGRKDNMFISGGENIQPEAIERILIAHPLIMEALVVPVPDDAFGQVPVAFIRTHGNLSTAAPLITAHLAEHLARFQIPRHYFPWPADIATPGIKPARGAFRERAIALIHSQE